MGDVGAWGRYYCTVSWKYGEWSDQFARVGAGSADSAGQRDNVADSNTVVDNYSRLFPTRTDPYLVQTFESRDNHNNKVLRNTPKYVTSTRFGCLQLSQLICERRVDNW